MLVISEITSPLVRLFEQQEQDGNEWIEKSEKDLMFLMNTWGSHARS